MLVGEDTIPSLKPTENTADAGQILMRASRLRAPRQIVLVWLTQIDSMSCRVPLGEDTIRSLNPAENTAHAGLN